MKYLSRTFTLFVSLSFLFLSTTIYGQTLPYTKYKSVDKSALNVPVYTLPQQNNSSLQEKYKPTPRKRMQIAEEVNLQWDFISKATKIDFQDQSAAYLMKLHSVDAFFMNVIFSRLSIVSGMSMFVYGAQPSNYHPIQAGMENAIGGYLSNMVKGDSLFIELDIPSDLLKEKVDIQIECVNHGFRPLPGNRHSLHRKGYGDSGNCEVDINCTNDGALQKLKRSVCRLIIDGRYFCTGTLMNSTSLEKPPYVLTANHCISTEDNAANTLFNFNYEAYPCGGLEGWDNDIINGAVLRATAPDLDFTLVEMEQSPSLDLRPYYAGWDNSGLFTTKVIGIHHPQGDVKKYSISNNSPSLQSYGENIVDGSSIYIKRWDSGVTEGGSSGSALFHEGLVVGSLIGGYASCAFPRNDYYSSLFYSWNHYSSSSMQLKAWLSPNSDVTSLAGYEPVSEDSSFQLVTNVEYDEQYEGSWDPEVEISSLGDRFIYDSSVVIHKLSFSLYFGDNASLKNNDVLQLSFYQQKDFDAGVFTPLQQYEIAVSSLIDDRNLLLALPSPLKIEGDHYVMLSLRDSNWDSSLLPYQAPKENDQDNTGYFVANGQIQPMTTAPVNKSVSFSIGELIKIENVTSIDPKKIQSEIRMYAMPQNGAGAYYIFSPSRMNDITLDIYNVEGKKLYSEMMDLPEGGKPVSLHGFNKGVYLFSFYHAGVHYSGKFLIP